MIYEDWYGVLNKKGELMSVDESEQIAQANANALETVIGVQTNKVVPVTVLAIPILDLINLVLKQAEVEQAIRRLAKIEADARPFKKEYMCPVCGSNNPNRYLTCDYPGCTDGRDPR